MSFIDKVAKGLNDGIATVSENSKNFVEKAKLSKKIDDLKKHKNQLFSNMGELVYNLNEDNIIHISQCESICKEIKQCTVQISQLQLQLTAFEHSDSKYFEQQPITDGIECKCGCMNSKDDLYCRLCGNILNTSYENTEE